MEENNFSQQISKIPTRVTFTNFHGVIVNLKIAIKMFTL
jgi:hypothetical protein